MKEQKDKWETIGIKFADLDIEKKGDLRRLVTEEGEEYLVYEFDPESEIKQTPPVGKESW
jgi:hypothetical protein